MLLPHCLAAKFLIAIGNDKVPYEPIVVAWTNQQNLMVVLNVMATQRIDVIVAPSRLPNLVGLGKY